MKPKWTAVKWTRWECSDDECDTWGGYGGESDASNLRRTKAAAREHTEETQHRTSVLVGVGFWE